jgi:uncharacterized protein
MSSHRIDVAATSRTTMAGRDGAALSTDVYLPEGSGPWPALLHRTPYGKDVLHDISLTFGPEQATSRGYAVVVQDCRGCGLSEGTFQPFVSERTDGHDAISWAATEPWCDGRVAIYGSSYMGATVLQAAIDPPEPLRAAAAYITASTYHDGWVWTQGAFELGMNVRWSLEMAERIGNRRGDLPSDVRHALAAFRSDPIGFLSSSLDISALPGVQSVSHWQDWAGRPDADAYWSSLDVVAAARDGKIAIPVLQIAGWYDMFCTSQVALHSALSGERGLVIGPWDHTAYWSSATQTTAGSRNFGDTSAGGQDHVGPLVLDWFDRWLKGSDRPTEAVRYFMIGPNEWNTSADWPPPHRQEKWFLSASRRLVNDPPTEDASDRLDYRPESPTPTVGGRHALTYVASGVQDYRPILDRNDVVVYFSDPLATQIPVTGPIYLELYAEATSLPTDFVAALLDVEPDGAARNVVDGVLRVKRFTEDTVSVSLGHTAYTFPVGHRIAVSIASSSFPRFDRTPTQAFKRIFHGPGRPSALVLPVVASG